MRYLLLSAILVSPAAAEDKSRAVTSVNYDGMGRPLTSPVTLSSSSPMGSRQVQIVDSVNGRKVPWESVDETVLSEGPSGKVVERIVRRFDPSGGVASTVKVRVEDRKNPDGSLTSTATTYDSNVNGGFSLRERSVSESTTAGSTTTTRTAIDRPSINGAVEPYERRTSVLEGDDKNSTLDVTVFRRDGHGTFRESAREMTTTESKNGEIRTDTVEYNNRTGSMALAARKIATTVKSPDGAEKQTVEQYLEGKRLSEVQTVERTPGPGQSVREIVTVRVPGVNTSKPGPPQKISETICTGSCRN